MTWRCSSETLPGFARTEGSTSWDNRIVKGIGTFSDRREHSAWGLPQARPVHCSVGFHRGRGERGLCPRRQQNVYRPPNLHGSLVQREQYRCWTTHYPCSLFSFGMPWNWGPVVLVANGSHHTPGYCSCLSGLTGNSSCCCFDVRLQSGCHNG